MRDPRHDILFQPLKIGPVTAKNRFYQVPHCNGMGWRRPRTAAAMRGMKAEGGWAVVNTEYCSIHPSSDNDPFPNATLWDDHDIRAHALMTDAVHAHDALAGVELWLGGGMVMNFGTRTPPLGLRDRPSTDSGIPHPVQTQRIDRQDIRNIRQWHKDAARRAVQAGFDIVYVYAAHGYLLSEFLDADCNNWTDEYGGSLENRTRLIRELIEETYEAVAGKAAVAVRYSVDPDNPETYDAFATMADMPDLWDLTGPDYSIEMGASRFVKEGALVDIVARAKAMTSKPVVSVGRFTSPDTMARVIASGAQDMIGAARPSIADPFLPLKIAEGRSDDIRECIGCNICYAHDSLGVPLRCTQNPTMGEEWRQGWHPERTGRAKRPEKVLVIGAGPSGLEAARVLGERGHEVMLAEAGRELGGHLSRIARLPGLAEWARVRDWRLGQIDRLANVGIYRESLLTAGDIPGLGADHVFIATGARWASDNIGRHSDHAVTDPGAMIVNAETVIDGAAIKGEHVVIYDDDHYVMGAVLALHLRGIGHRVTLVTPAGRAGSWGSYTAEIHASNHALAEAGVEIVTNHRLSGLEAGRAILAHVFSDREMPLACDAVVPLTRRIPQDDLFHALADSGLKTLLRIGDAEAPSLLAAAVHSGYAAAISFGTKGGLAALTGRREHPLLRE
ncbi:MAG: FAD-dependent oxidoreductase [Rhodobacteraceae bacterium]|nr:FAD-dependent oxidoreductase [Paracoccaceae bacterium]